MVLWQTTTISLSSCAAHSYYVLPYLPRQLYHVRKLLLDVQEIILTLFSHFQSFINGESTFVTPNPSFLARFNEVVLRAATLLQLRRRLGREGRQKKGGGRKSLIYAAKGQSGKGREERKKTTTFPLFANRREKKTHTIFPNYLRNGVSAICIIRVSWIMHEWYQRASTLSLSLSLAWKKSGLPIFFLAWSFHFFFAQRLQ